MASSVSGLDDARDRTEVLGQMELAAARDALADAGRPQRPRVILAARLDDPSLALLEHRQPAQQLALGRRDHRPDARALLVRISDLVAVGRVEQLPAEALALLTDPTSTTSDAAEHFWPAWPNAE